MYQYKIIVNDQESKITDSVPTAWENNFDIILEKGLKATLYRRLVTDIGILPMLTDTKGYIILKDRVICPWQIIAENK